MLAPVCLFVYNRLSETKQTVESLQKNPLANESELFIFSDGPKNDAGKEKVKQVREFIKTITGFKSVTIFKSEINKGLANSIISGVTKIMELYGKVIVVEDDLLLSGNFLHFMNNGLNYYEKEQKVFSICGYTNRVKIPQSYTYDAYFCTRSSSWGWATWHDRWETIDWDLADWAQHKRLKLKFKFNRWGGSDCFSLLQAVKELRNDSWAIRFCFSQFLQGKLALFPVISKVQNDGFVGSEGTNCHGYSRFKYIFDIGEKMNFSFPSEIELNKQLYHSAMSYHTIRKRIYSRVINIFYPLIEKHEQQT
jgi:hypothetical protein